jgi:hypothetical protein
MRYSTSKGWIGRKVNTSNGGRTYLYYLLCQDLSGREGTVRSLVNFEINHLPTSIIPSWLCVLKLESDVNSVLHSLHLYLYLRFVPVFVLYSLT